MKKLAIIILVLSMLFLTTSCDILEQIIATLPTPGGDIGLPDGDEIYGEMTQDDYDRMNKLLETLDNNVVVTVETKKAGIILTSVYAITEEYVKYSVQSLAMLPSDGDIINMPSDMIITVSGDAKYNDRGELIDEDGNFVSLPDGGDHEFFGAGMHLEAENFSDARISESDFEGDAISAAKLFNVDTDVQGIGVRIEYQGDEITFMSLYYNKGGADVYVTYDFNTL